MILNFADALTALGQGAAMRIANQARPPANYLFNTFLPERNFPDYQVNAANMIVRTTMAGLVAMDSPYPPGGFIEVSSFLQNTGKFGIQSRLPEGSLRQIQGLLRQMQVTAGSDPMFLAREAINFLDKVVVQALVDNDEWLRGQALVQGAINWTFNSKPVNIDYGIPVANKLPLRTDASNNSYSDSGSLFWTDVQTARRLLHYNLRAAVINSATLDKIVTNAANNIQILNQTLTSITIQRLIRDGTTGAQRPDSDSRYTLTLTIYDEEAEVMDTNASNAGRPEAKKFMPDGKILYVGSNNASGYRVGQGSTDNPRNDLELGYHHMAPTIEGGGAPGRWARLYVPEGYPMMLQGEGAENSLPVILAPDKIVIASTELLP